MRVTSYCLQGKGNPVSVRGRLQGLRFGDAPQERPPKDTSTKQKTRSILLFAAPLLLVSGSILQGLWREVRATHPPVAKPSAVMKFEGQLTFDSQTGACQLLPSGGKHPILIHYEKTPLKLYTAYALEHYAKPYYEKPVHITGEVVKRSSKGEVLEINLGELY